MLQSEAGHHLGYKGGVNKLRFISKAPMIQVGRLSFLISLGIILLESLLQARSLSIVHHGKKIERADGTCTKSSTNHQSRNKRIFVQNVDPAIQNKVSCYVVTSTPSQLAS